jgi:hypothetical protein
MKHTMPTDEAGSFLGLYPDPVRDVGLVLRQTILAALPRVEETVDRPGRVLGYSFGTGYAGAICTIIPSKTGIKLGIVNGASLDDRAGLLEGTGKRHKYVVVKDAATAKSAAVKALLKTAYAAWNDRHA